MRRIILVALVCFAASASYAQNDSAARKNVLRPAAAANRSGDHFMIQLGYTKWANQPDSINTGFSRTFNMYVMFDFPFKTNEHWSVAIGPGIATDNIFFDKMSVGISEPTSTLRFTDLSDTNHFKKYKVLTAYLEAPVELRYNFNPQSKNSVKIALGAKVGTLLSASTKGKNLEDKEGNSVNSFTEKIKSKTFFNRNRLSVMGRVGFGHFSVFTSYAVTPVFKEGLGPNVRPFTIGLTISGL
jgi:hypothetical protein